MPIPKTELNKRKRQQRKDANLVTVTLHCTPFMRMQLINEYANLCDQHKIPPVLRTKFK